MTENVVSLRPGDAQASVNPPTTKVPNEGLIRFLEQVLQDARSGDIIGMASSYMTHDYRAGFAIIGTVGGFSMQGALHCALLEIGDLNRSGGEDSD